MTNICLIQGCNEKTEETNLLCERHDNIIRFFWGQMEKAKRNYSIKDKEMVGILQLLLDDEKASQ